MNKGEAKLLTSSGDSVSGTGRQGLGGAALLEADTARPLPLAQNCDPLQLQSQDLQTLDVKARTLST